MDLRRQPRFKFEVDIRVKSRTCGLLKGRSVDTSESGIAAMLVIEAPVGEVVELDFALPFCPVMIRALLRQKSAFRHGFEFIDSDSVHEFIRRTCRDLAVQQSLIFPSVRRRAEEAMGNLSSESYRNNHLYLKLRNITPSK